LLIYLDVSCLNRPFDDQAQMRIRLEAESVTLIFSRIDSGQWEQASSEIAEIEIDAMPDADRRRRVQTLLPDEADRISLSPSVFDRAVILEPLGFKGADALHIACAEEAKADVLLTCDDRLLRAAQRQVDHLKVRVANPLDWIKEMHDAPNA
jgi:predicted nucleic acid-binding protein